MRPLANLANLAALCLAVRILAACAWLTAHEAQLERLACDLVAFSDDIPAELEAKACASPADATKPHPVSAAAVKAKAKAIAAAPPVQARHVVPDHGVIVDRRVTVGESFPVRDAGAVDAGPLDAGKDGAL